MERLDDLRRFYAALDVLEQRLGRKRTLANSHGRMEWPARGVYFFFEPGEDRSESGTGLRVVRVGTHAVSGGSRSKLWGRLAQHKGTGTGGGNHRGSIFRKIIGEALVASGQMEPVPTWGQGNTASREVRLAEHAMEQAVSAHIRAMPFLWVEADDMPSAQSVRATIERNAIALLSSHGKPPLDAPSPQWLGNSSPREKVRASGLWNNNYVDDASYDPAFLATLERLAGLPSASV